MDNGLALHFDPEDVAAATELLELDLHLGVRNAIGGRDDLQTLRDPHGVTVFFADGATYTLRRGSTWRMRALSLREFEVTEWRAGELRDRELIAL